MRSLTLGELELLSSAEHDGVKRERRVRGRRVHAASTQRPRLSRRMRRCVNDALLVEVDETEAKALFDIAPRKASAFQKLLAQPAAVASFTATDMEHEQCKYERDKERLSRAVDRRVKAVVKEKRYLRQFVERIEESVLQLPPGGTLALVLSDSLSRLIAHGVAQFYQMAHRSMNVGRQRVTYISSKHAQPPLPAVRMVDILF